MAARSSKTLLLSAAGLAALGWAVLAADPRPGAAAPSAVASAAPPTAADPVAGFDISGPYTHDNLSVFLLHGPDTLPPRPIATLSDALAAKSFVVHETGTVNTLVVENLSDTDDVLIQPGDIVKGGRQDRLIASAVLVPPKSGKVDVPSFCVEQGRWAGRGAEAATHFGKSDEVIAGKALKQAAVVNGNQSEVWENVKKTQQKLAENAGKPSVQNAASPTSLQLALEDADVRKRLEAYTAALTARTTGRRHVVGFAVAVNGKLTGAEVYGSAAVMAKAWPKALRSAATEALSEKDAKGTFAAPSAVACRAFLADAEKGQSEAVAKLDGPHPGQPRGDDREQFILLGLNQAEQIRLPLDAIPAPPNFEAAEDRPAGRSSATRSQQVQQLARQSDRNHPGPGGHRGPVPDAAPVGPTQVNRVTGQNATLVECRDQKNPGVVIHRSFVAR